MTIHAPPGQLRPPDATHFDLLPFTHNPTEGFVKQINTDAAIVEQTVDATVQNIAHQSPTGRSSSSGNNLQNVNRGNDFPAQKTTNPPISVHSTVPIISTGQANSSGELLIGKNGTPSTGVPTTDHLNNQHNFIDQYFQPLTSNFIPSNRNHWSNTQSQKRSNPPDARQNAKDTSQPLDDIQTNVPYQNIQHHSQLLNVPNANTNVHPTALNNAPLPASQVPSYAQQVINVPLAQLNQKFNQPQSKNAPVPPNVVPSYAARLRASQGFGEEEIDISPPLITTKQGLPAVIFKREDFMHKLATKCKYTLIGKFSTTMPKMEVIRSSLTSQLQIKGACKVTHFNSTHVYIDLDNEIDHAVVWNKERIFIGGRLMRLLIWTPNFTPEEETPIAPLWVVLPHLPWHCYTMAFVSKLLEPVGRVLFFDAASIQRTRGSVAKVKIEIDITKPRPPHVWLGFPQNEGDIYGEGRWQELQFENIPDYCSHCKRQGHPQISCKIKFKDDEYHMKKKEQEENDTVMSNKKDNYKLESTGPSHGRFQQRYETDISTQTPIDAMNSPQPNARPDSHRRMTSKPPVQKQQYVAKLDLRSKNSFHALKEAEVEEGCSSDEPSKISGPDIPTTATVDGTEHVTQAVAQPVGDPSGFHTVQQQLNSGAQQHLTVLQKNGPKIESPVGQEMYPKASNTPAESEATVKQGNTPVFAHVTAQDVGEVEVHIVCEGILPDAVHSQLNQLAQVTAESVPTPTLVPGNGQKHERVQAMHHATAKCAAAVKNSNAEDTIDTTVAANDSEAVPVATAATDMVGKGEDSTKAWVEKSFGKSPVCCSAPVGQGNSSVPTSVGPQNVLQHHAINTVLTGEHATAGKEQMAGNAPVIAPVQHTCAANALILQPERKNKKFRKHDNDPPVEVYESKAIPETSPLMPISQLEVICNEASNFIRVPNYKTITLEQLDLMSVHDIRRMKEQDQVSPPKDRVCQKVPNYKTITLEQLELMSVHDIYRMQEQQATLPKERPPQQPKRAQPARSSKSNSTRGR